MWTVGGGLPTNREHHPPRCSNEGPVAEEPGGGSTGTPDHVTLAWGTTKDLPLARPFRYRTERPIAGEPRPKPHAGLDWRPRTRRRRAARPWRRRTPGRGGLHPGGPGPYQRPGVRRPPGTGRREWRIRRALAREPPSRRSRTSSARVAGRVAGGRGRRDARLGPGPGLRGCACADRRRPVRRQRRGRARGHHPGDLRWSRAGASRRRRQRRADPAPGGNRRSWRRSRATPSEPRPT